MPELPEVETVRRGLQPFCKDKTIEEIIVRHSRLRWEIPCDIAIITKNQPILSVSRRGKYLLLELPVGTLMIHLGMSGVIQVCDSSKALLKHDHVDIILNDGTILRYSDPRRFGAILFTTSPIEEHPLINHLGPEPLLDNFNSSYIYAKTRGKNTPLKTWLMNADNVVGIGNIYANEILFHSNLYPLLQAKQLTSFDCDRLYISIKKILEKAIAAGGTTLKDFKTTQGKPGYFVQQLQVYGKAGKDCPWCAMTLKSLKIAARQTVYCANCQPDI